MGTATPPPIGPALAALLARPVSANVASRDNGHRPHLTRAVGFRLAPDLQHLTVFLAASTSACVLADLRANGRIAVVFSEPSTHRTLQVKGSDAVMAPATPDDLVVLRAYWQAFTEEIGALGFGPRVAQTIFEFALDDIVGVRLTPQAAFDQTPGPRAGEALASGMR
jgi:hypothetical protein